MTIIGAAAPLAMAGALAAWLGSERAGWSVMAAILGVVAAAPLLVTWRVTRGYELFPAKTEVGWRDIFRRCPSQPHVPLHHGHLYGQLRRHQHADGGGRLLPHYVMHYSENMSSLVLFVYVVVGTAWLPVVNLVTRRWASASRWLPSWPSGP